MRQAAEERKFAQAEQMQQANDYFAANSEQIITDVWELIDQDKPKQVLKELEQYEHIDSSDIRALISMANNNVDRQRDFENSFRYSTGEHVQLVSLVKQSMNDPESFRHVETNVYKGNNPIQVKMIYAGKNVFGGYVRAYVTVSIDNRGNIIEVLDQGN